MEQKGSGGRIPVGVDEAVGMGVGGFMLVPLPNVKPLVPSGMAGVGLAAATVTLCTVSGNLRRRQVAMYVRSWPR